MTELIFVHVFLTNYPRLMHVDLDVKTSQAASFAFNPTSQRHDMADLKLRDSVSWFWLFIFYCEHEMSHIQASDHLPTHSQPECPPFPISFGSSKPSPSSPMRSPPPSLFSRRNNHQQTSQPSQRGYRGGTAVREMCNSA